MVEPKDQELSGREREILRLVATGASNKEIAQALAISPNTVKVHLRNIFAKIEVTSRTEATLFAIRSGLVQVASAGALRETGEGEDDETLPPGAPEPAVSEPPRPQPGAATRRRRAWALAAGGGMLALGLGLGLWWAATRLAASPVPAPTQAASPGPGGEPIVVVDWEARAPLPTARTGMATAAYDGQIYVVGGETAAGVTGRLERYDRLTDQWVVLAPKPTAVAEASAVVIGGRLYVPGGRLADGAITDVLEVYDPRADAWTRGAPLPVGLSAYALAAFEGKLYVFGGWDGQRYVASVFAYAPDVDRWEARSAMPTARGLAGAAVAGGRLYVVGGTDGARVLTVNEVYAPEEERAGGRPWQVATPLPAGRSRLSAAGLAGAVYVVGSAEAGPVALAAFLPQIQTWQTFAAAADHPLPAHSSLVALESELHLIGGEQAATPSPAHLAFQAVFTTLLPNIGK